MNSIQSINFHDANFNGIQIEQNKAELSFQLSDGAFVKVLLGNIKSLLCDGFREGNIVLEMVRSNDVDICEPLLNVLFPAPAGVLGKHYAFMDLMREKLFSGELTILHISPSYGGDLIALCESVEIIEKK